MLEDWVPLVRQYAGGCLNMPEGFLNLHELIVTCCYETT